MYISTQGVDTFFLNRTFQSGHFGLSRFGLSGFGLGGFGLAVSVWGAFDHDISVHKQLSAFVCLNPLCPNHGPHAAQLKVLCGPV